MLFNQSPMNRYFNNLFYKKTYNLNNLTDKNLYNHYINIGSKLNYNPSLYFDTKWYREKYNINNVTNPLIHFQENMDKGFLPNEKCDVLIRTGINKLPWINITGEFIPIITEKRRINIILPGPGLSAGPQTLYAFANLLATKGLNIRIIIMYFPMSDEQEYIKEIRERMEFHDSIEIVSHYENDIIISFDDIFVVSAWWTIYPLKFILNYLNNKKFFWFIQEMELIFHQGDEIYSKALECYNMDYYSFVHCSTMLDYLKDTNFMCFKNNDYIQNNVICFEPNIDNRLFYCQEKSNEKTKILFYSRDTAPRNLNSLIIELLINSIKNKIIDSNCEIIGFGGSKPGKFILTNNYHYTEVGFLNLEDYSKLMRSAHIVINFVLSPHTGLIPLEIASCGGICIHNKYFTKNEESIKKYTDKILISEPNQIDLMRNLKTAIYLMRNNLISNEPPKLIRNNFKQTLEPCFDFLIKNI